MLMLFDFRCAHCGHEQESLADSQSKKASCNMCGEESTRMISPVRSKLDGTDPGFPTAYDKWGRQHEKAGQSQP